MKNTKQFLLAFFIPMMSAIAMFLFGLFIFKSPAADNKPKFFSDEIILSYCLSCYPLVAGTYLYFVFCLVLLSFILPFFVVQRIEQSRNRKIESIVK